MEEEWNKPCSACGERHLGFLSHPDECPLPPPYDYPYSNRCGRCGERTIKENVCQGCGCDYRPKTCPECNCYYATAWDEKGGCPACQGIVSKPVRRPPPSEGEQMFWRRSEGEY